MPVTGSHSDSSVLNKSENENYFSAKDEFRAEVASDFQNNYDNSLPSFSFSYETCESIEKHLNYKKSRLQ